MHCFSFWLNYVNVLSLFLFGCEPDLNPSISLIGRSNSGVGILKHFLTAPVLDWPFKSYVSLARNRWQTNHVCCAMTKSSPHRRMWKLARHLLVYKPQSNQKLLLKIMLKPNSWKHLSLDQNSFLDIKSQYQILFN